MASQEEQREKTKAQLLFHPLQEKGQLSEPSVPQSSVIRLSIRDSSLILQLNKPRMCLTGRIFIICDFTQIEGEVLPVGADSESVKRTSVYSHHHIRFKRKRPMIYLNGFRLKVNRNWYKLKIIVQSVIEQQFGNGLTRINTPHKCVLKLVHQAQHKDSNTAQLCPQLTN